MFDYRKLRGKIKEVLGNQGEYSKALQISNTALTNKLHNRTFFTQREIDESIVLLNIDPSEIYLYFFTK